MSYSPPVQVHYIKANNDTSSATRLIPAPQISISPEYIYVNDNLIGATYSVTLNGYATSIDRTSNTSGIKGFNDVLQSIQHVRNVFNHNGGILKIFDDNGDIILASGAIIQSMSFEESPNYWFNYSQYSITLSCQTVDFGNCASPPGLTCEELPAELLCYNSPELLDMINYKVSSASENLDINSENSFISYHTSGIYNEYLTVSYNIEAVGKNYMNDGVLMPGWQQAKNFCQYRLRQQAHRLKTHSITPLLNSSADSSVCDGTTTTHANMSTTQTFSLLYQLTDYTVYNESLECSASESDGSFSLKYNSILKRDQPDETLFKNECIYRITTNRESDYATEGENLKESIQGEIEGLIEGGLINNPDLWELPNSGILLIGNKGSGINTAYNSALAGYNLLVESDNNKGKRLKNALVATTLGITKASLGGTGSDRPNKKLHTVSHNYNAGTISFSEEYDNLNIGIGENDNNSITNISISIDDALPAIAEFVVPGRAEGPIYQVLTAKQPRRITVSIDGMINMAEEESTQSIFDTNHFQNVYCTGMTLPPGVPESGLTGYEITENTFNMNYGDGTYTINRAYVKIGDDI